MKKILSILSVFCCIFFFSFGIQAEELTYQNVITDNTTIEEDFKVLEMDMSNYYLAEVYKDFERAYVVAMSEAYTNNKNIQTYFYVYCPLEKEITIESLSYKLNGKSGTYTNDNGQLQYIKNRGLYKYKGFTYDYVATAKLEITEVKFRYSTKADSESGLKPMAALPPIGTTIKTITSKSDFTGTINHNLASDNFTCELNYNSTIVIDSQGVDIVEIDSESNLKNIFNTIPHSILRYNYSLGHAYFYNFNFPDNIAPDSIEYAKFEYDKTKYHKTKSGSIEIEEDIKGEIHEYTPGTKEIKIDKQSETLSFQTFVLGNRVEKGEFGYLKINEEDKKKYDVDCSILLDIFVDEYIDHKVWTTFPGMVGGGIWTHVKEEWYTELDKVQILELHYMEDGKLYQCQVVVKPIDKDDFTHTQPEHESIWKRIYDFLVKIGGWIVKNVFRTGAPEIVKFFVGIGTLLLGLVLSIVICVIVIPKIILLIIKSIINIVLLPFKLIGKIFNR